MEVRAKTNYCSWNGENEEELYSCTWIWSYLLVQCRIIPFIVTSDRQWWNGAHTCAHTHTHTHTQLVSCLKISVHPIFGM